MRYMHMALITAEHHTFLLFVFKFYFIFRKLFYFGFSYTSSQRIKLSKSYFNEECSERKQDFTLTVSLSLY